MATELDAGTDHGNFLYILYSGTLTEAAGNFRAVRVYFPVCFCDIVSADGTLQYGSNRGILGQTALAGNQYTTSGYKNPFDCYRDIVEANRDTRNTVCGDGFEGYAEQKTIAAMADLDEAYRETLYADARDYVESRIESGLYTTRSSDLVFEGDGLLIPKNPGADNRYVIVYSATVSPAAENALWEQFDPVTVYFPVVYDAILILPNGEYLVSGSMGILSSSYLDGGHYIKTAGYTDSQTMFAEVFTAKRSDYTCELSDELKKFGE